jgi:hypothetical protein
MLQLPMPTMAISLVDASEPMGATGWFDIKVAGAAGQGLGD